MMTTPLTFVLTMPDGAMHHCDGAVRREANGSWQISVVTGPDLRQSFLEQSAPLRVEFADGRVGQVVVANDVTLVGIDELAWPKQLPA